MVTITAHCPHCGSDALVRNGRAPSREEILRAYEERSSLRGLERTFGVSRTTVITWIKKSG